MLRAQLLAALRGHLLEIHRDGIAPEIVWNLEQSAVLTAEENHRIPTYGSPHESSQTA